MLSHNITGDINLIEKLFWVFDENGSGDVKYEEFVLGIEMFKESASMEDKLRVFFDLCDKNKKGSISSENFFDLLKKNVIYSEDKLELKRIGKINYIIINIIKN